MRQRVLLVARHLGERAAVAVVGDEHGVVPEPTVTTRRLGDRAPAHAVDDQLGAVGTTHDHTGAERSTAIRPTGELAEQLGAIVGVRAALAGVAGRIHARRPVQRVDLEAGVVGDGSEAGRVADRDGFESRVALERVGVLHDVGNLGRSRHEIDDATQDRLDLGHLVGVGGGAHETRELAHRGRRRGRHQLALGSGDLRQTPFGERQQRVEFATA